MASSEPSSVTEGSTSEKLEVDMPSSPHLQHEAFDPDREVENSISEELLQLVLRESEAARLPQEGGGSGWEEEGGGEAYSHGGFDDWSGWEDDQGGGGAAGVYDSGEGRDSDWESGACSVRYSFPVRPGAEDCSYYMRTGTCKFGSLCKFNHPVRGRNPAARERINDREEHNDKVGLIECKYYLRTGGCRYGKACKFNHPRTKPLGASPLMELNFLGLPIRPGEKECPYYMRNGSCKYAANCKFNHPDPTGSGSGGGAGDHLSGYGNGTSSSLKAPPQSLASWSPSPRTLNEAASFVPAVYSPPFGGVAPHKAEWSTYQIPVYQPERGMLPTQAYMGNNLGNGAAAYNNDKNQMIIDEFPERPGQPDCTFFLKTGDCKFKSNCKYHHPKNRIPISPVVPLSDKGLPLRPDQNICSYYSRYGICKFGPVCRFDHPVNWTPSNLSAPFSSFAGPGVSRMVGTSNAGDLAIQQSL
ncbi:hypothetical protein SAY86_031355 [Trapa natans]|uniref:C3H1-type domain-containing protein n=1 Tax=Trapa natans TaxID=22666 RepID=A0AAN7M304_TRANT|nr:hypothetical protein SAY86_031355 [Trapa natans]